MKRYLILLLALLCASPSLAATKAQQIEFLLSQVRNSSGPLSGGTVTFYGAGTTAKKTVWLDRDKTIQAANPYTLDANGTAHIYAEGIYRVVVKNSQGGIVYDRDNLAFVAFSATETANAQTVGGYFPSVDPVGSTVVVRDGNGAMKGNILGNAITLGSYSSSKLASPNRVAVRDSNGKLAGDVLGSAATVGGFTPSLTATAGQIPVLANTTGSLSIPGTFTGKAIDANMSGAGSVGGMTSTSYGAGTDAFITFNRAGTYAVNLGIDSSNQLKVGGYSAGALATVWTSSNDGVGTELDAGKLGGELPAFYQPASTAITTANIAAQSVSAATTATTATNTTGTGSIPYTRSENGLRIIRGEFNTSGTITAGAGFTVSGSTPNYTVTWSNAFTATPTIIASTGTYVTVRTNGKSTTAWTLSTVDSNNNETSNGNVQFIAIGPN